jgi:hypothetical protein
VVEGGGDGEVVVVTVESGHIDSGRGLRQVMVRQTMVGCTMWWTWLRRTVSPCSWLWAIQGYRLIRHLGGIQSCSSPFRFP